eukprot:c49908_g1_i1 orf=39-233(+)
MMPSFCGYMTLQKPLCSPDFHVASFILFSWVLSFSAIIIGNSCRFLSDGVRPCVYFQQSMRSFQ